MNFAIFGKPACPYCEMAKQLLTQRDREFEYFTLDEDYNFEALQDRVATFTPVPPRTFPQIFVEQDNVETYVGGFTELREFMAQIGN